MIAFALSRCMAHANRIGPALEMSEVLFSEDNELDVAHAFLIPLIPRMSVASAGERSMYVRSLLSASKAVEDRKQPAAAAALQYNAGNTLRSMSRFRASLRCYRKAAALDESYLKRSYYWRELGGVLFLSRRYSSSVGAYRKALELEEDRFTRALYGDALMFSGQFLAAKDAFDISLRTPGGLDSAEWALKSCALAFLREVTGLESQSRRRAQFPVLSDFEIVDDKEAEAICRSVLESDALSPVAWFNLGCLFLRSGNKAGAMHSFLMAALVQPGDIEAWTNVFALGLEHKNDALAGNCLIAGYSINGEEFLTSLAERVSSKQSEFASHLSSMIELLPKRDGRVLLRGHFAPGRWKEVEILPSGQKVPENEDS